MIADENVLEIFAYYKRSRLDIAQLVCRRWNGLITKYVRDLPQYCLKSLSIAAENQESIMLSEVYIHMDCYSRTQWPDTRSAVLRGEKNVLGISFQNYYHLKNKHDNKMVWIIQLDNMPGELANISTILEFPK
uniref:F-box domain-containing protein n=1 Tax=Ditylenchus dipsaci TaxID=166011 RepID=A0A915CRX4_9BILA